MEKPPTPVKVLIVDDSPGMRSIMKTLLAGQAVSFSECGDGEDAVTLYGAELPDWVLMDIRMPRLDGLGAMRMIRQQHPGAKVVIVTDYDDPDLRAEARALGAAAYVLKEDLKRLQQIIAGETGDS